MNMHSSILTDDILLDDKDNPEDILFLDELAHDMGEIAILDKLIIGILEDTNNEQSKVVA